MTRRALERRVEFWRALLAPEWRITLSDRRPGADDDPDDDQYHATIRSAEDYLHATLWVRADFYGEAEASEVDVTIVHELVHLLMRELRRTMDLIVTHVHRDTYTVLDARFRTEEERLVERVARIIARLEHPDGLLYGTYTD